MLRERAANEKAHYLRELEEWTKKGNKDMEQQSAFESHHYDRHPKQQLFLCMDRSNCASKSGNDFDGHRMDRNFNHRNAPHSVWRHEKSSAHLGMDQQDSAPSSPLTMPPPPMRTPATRQSSIMWQHEESVANLQDAPPQPPLWRSPSSVVDIVGCNNHSQLMNISNDCLMGMSSEVGLGMSMISMNGMSDLLINDQCSGNGNGSYSGAVPAFQGDEDFNEQCNKNFHVQPKYNFASMHEVQHQRQQQLQDYVSMFQKMDVHDTGMRNMMMMMHQNQQHHQRQYEQAPVHQNSLRQHLSYGASFHNQQQQRQSFRNLAAPSIPVIDTQRRVRRPRRKSAPTLNPGNDRDDVHLDVEQQPQQRRGTFAASSNSSTLQDDEKLHLSSLLTTFD